MKKCLKYIISFLTGLIAIFGLIIFLGSCNKSDTKNLTGEMSVVATGSTLKITCSVSDPDGIATVGSVMVHYWEYDSDTEEKSNGSTLKYSNLPGVESDGSVSSETKTATGLKSDQTYYLKFYCTVGEEEYVFEEKEVQTNTDGQDLSKPIEINTADELYSMKDDLDAYYVLKSDINLSTYSGTNKGEPIFSSSTYKFSGHLDGASHTIYSFSETTSNQYSGLFGYIGEDGVIENVNIDSSTVSFTRSSTGYQGSFAAYNEGTIKNCTVTAASLTYKASSTSNAVETNVGGFIGANYGTIENCSVSGSITCEYKLKINVGGFVGANYGKISNSKSNMETSLSSTSTSTSTKYLTFNAGGFVGFNERKIESSIATGSLTGKYSYEKTNKNISETLGHNLGGFVGNYNQGNLNSNLVDMDLAYESSQSFVANIACFAGYVATNLDASMAQNNVVYATGHTLDINVLDSEGKFNFEYEHYKKDSETESETRTSVRTINFDWLNSLDTEYKTSYYAQKSYALIGEYDFTCDESSVNRTITQGSTYKDLESNLDLFITNYISDKSK